MAQQCVGVGPAPIIAKDVLILYSTGGIGYVQKFAIFFYKNHPAIDSFTRLKNK